MADKRHTTHKSMCGLQSTRCLHDTDAHNPDQVIRIVYKSSDDLSQLSSKPVGYYKTLLRQDPLLHLQK